MSALEFRQWLWNCKFTISPLIPQHLIHELGMGTLWLFTLHKPFKFTCGTCKKTWNRTEMSIYRLTPVYPLYCTFRLFFGLIGWSLSSCWFPICCFWCSWNVSLINKLRVFLHAFPQLLNLHLVIFPWEIDKPDGGITKTFSSATTSADLCNISREDLKYGVSTLCYIWLDNVYHVLLNCQNMADWEQKVQRCFCIFISVCYFYLFSCHLLSWIKSSEGSYHKGICEYLILRVDWD